MARTKKPVPATVPQVDAFDALLNEATEIAPKKTASKKKDRDHLKLSGPEQLAFDRFAMADASLKMAKGNQEAAKALILPVMTDKLLNLWCEEGCRTDNPEIRTEKGRAILQARETLRFELPTDEAGKTGTVTEMLTQAGFDLAEATKIREQEFTEKPEMRLADVNKLRDNTETKPLADRLLELILKNFNPEERKKLITKVNTVEVREGFLDRAVGLVERDPAKLKALLTTIRPQFLMSHIVWSGDLKDAMTALQTEDGKTLPTDTPTIKPLAPAAPPKPTVFTSDCGMWKATAQGNNAKLFMIQGTNEIPMADKTCSGGADHAKMTCQKWMRDPDYRAESMKKTK